ncbi:hypothetical protein R3P38DRAFT_2797884 [Favolaschia claudopus]|uniref:Uncharacterized protein n=1 Tax=Favolaschia claudopus TaxID=2862362 RepID=A0AAW0A2D7_9AGAR
MVNPYLDWIWSKYITSPHPEQDMLSLRETCSALVKYTLLPSDTVLSGGGYVLRHDLATTLAHAICAMDHLLDLSARHLGLNEIPAIGRIQLDILSSTGAHHGIATQNQIVTNWVSVLDHIWTAKHQLKALCAGDVQHPSLHTTASNIGSLATGLPLVLRRKLPHSLIVQFGIKLEEPPEPSESFTTSPSSQDPISSFSKTSLDALVGDWRTYMRMDFTDLAVWIVNADVGHGTLDAVFLYFVMDTIKQIQILLTELGSSSTPQAMVFEIDPHGDLKRMLQNSDDLKLLTKDEAGV